MEALNKSISEDSFHTPGWHYALVDTLIGLDEKIAGNSSDMDVAWLVLCGLCIHTHIASLDITAVCVC